MQLSIKHKFAFLCVPKCGSTSVEFAIRRHCETRITGHPSMKHLNAKRFKRYIRPLLHKADPHQKIEVFCIMRDPVERVESWYRYQTRKQLADPAHPEHRRYCGLLTFTQFIEGYLAEKQPPYAQIGTMAQFVRLKDGTLGVDRIFRLDQMDAVAEYLSAKIGVPIEIQVANQSAAPPRKPQSFLDRLTSVSSNEEPPESDVKPPRAAEGLPPALKQQLLDHLADDYLIYNSLTRA